MLSHVMSITKREKNKQFIISFFFREELAFALTWSLISKTSLIRCNRPWSLEIAYKRLWSPRWSIISSDLGDYIQTRMYFDCNLWNKYYLAEIKHFQLHVLLKQNSKLISIKAKLNDMLQKFVLIAFQGGVEDRFRFRRDGIGFYLANRNFRTLCFNEWIARLRLKLIGFLAAMRFCHDWLDLMGDLGAMSCYTGFSSHEGFKSFYQFLTRNFRLLKQMTFVFGVACHYEGKRKVFRVLWMSHDVANRTDREKHFLFSLLCQLIRHFHSVNGHGKWNFLRGVYADFF